MTATNSLANTWSAGAVGRVAAPVREQVIAALRSAILEFRLKPGQRLVERELIESLGVSRTTIREALRELASEGIVTVAPQRGAFVASPTPEEAADLYEARLAIDGVVLRMFVERASRSEFAELEAAFERFAEASERSAEAIEILRMRDEWGKALHQGAHSEVLTQLADSLRVRIQVLRVKAMSAGHGEAVRELRAVMAAMRDGNPDLAVELYTQHLRRAKANALTSLVDTTKGS
jgi:DNA-binding GntR family transcriptional regulator